MPICNIEREIRIIHLLISVQEPETKLAQNQQVFEIRVSPISLLYLLKHPPVFSTL
jgi:hypothetical protein